MSTCFHFSSFWKNVLRDTEQNSMCWQGECETCSKAKILVPNKLLGSTTKLQQREVVFNPKNSPNWEGIENIDPNPSNLTKSLYNLLGEIMLLLKKCMRCWLYHSKLFCPTSSLNKSRQKSLRRIRQIQLTKLSKLIMPWHISACIRWGVRSTLVLGEHKPVHLCTDTSGPATTMVICTDYRSKDKFSNRIFLEYLYHNIIPKNDEDEEEIIWSDGPTSEFKNKYMCHFMDKFSTKYNKRFLWTFSATSHSKGVVDGIGGNVKSIVQSQSREKERTR